MTSQTRSQLRHLFIPQPTFRAGGPPCGSAAVGRRAAVVRRSSGRRRDAADGSPACRSPNGSQGAGRRFPPLSRSGVAGRIRGDTKLNSPQYSQMFPTMALSDFKFIYYWEWSHRLLGRLIGIAFALPLARFWVRGQAEQAALAIAGRAGAWWPARGGWLVDGGGFGPRRPARKWRPKRLMIHLISPRSPSWPWLHIAVGLSGQSDRDATSWAKRGGLILVSLPFCCRSRSARWWPVRGLGCPTTAGH